jgi:hypothetical protein
MSIVWPNPNDVANQTTFGQMVGVSQQTISKLKVKRVLVDGGTFADWLSGYIDRLRLEAAGRDQDDRLSEGRIRETEMSANLKELEYLAKLKQVVWVADVEPLVVELCSAVQFNVMAAQERILEGIESKHSLQLDDDDIGKHLRSALEAVASSASEFVKRVVQSDDGDEAATDVADARVEPALLKITG